MTEQIRLRIDSQLAEEADVICREIGITPTAAEDSALAGIASSRKAGRLESFTGRL